MVNLKASVPADGKFPAFDRVVLALLNVERVSKADLREVRARYGMAPTRKLIWAAYDDAYNAARGG